jgi:hypothetical protein
MDRVLALCTEGGAALLAPMASPCTNLQISKTIQSQNHDFIDQAKKEHFDIYNILLLRIFLFLFVA